MTITITIPEKISLNKIYAGVHWAIRSQHKDNSHVAVMSAKPALYPGPFPVNFHYHFKLHGKLLDTSNHFYLTKLVEDGLVACGVIPDDCPKYVAKISVSAEKAKVGEDDVVIVQLSPSD